MAEAGINFEDGSETTKSLIQWFKKQKLDKKQHLTLNLLKWDLLGAKTAEIKNQMSSSI